MTQKAYRSQIFHLLDDPQVDADAYQYFKDGLLIVEDGQCNGLEATAAAQKLVNIDKVKIILGDEIPRNGMVDGAGEQQVERADDHHRDPDGQR